MMQKSKDAQYIPLSETEKDEFNALYDSILKDDSTDMNYVKFKEKLHGEIEDTV
jgi:hypothetical protein